MFFHICINPLEGISDPKDVSHRKLRYESVDLATARHAPGYADLLYHDCRLL